MVVSFFVDVFRYLNCIVFQRVHFFSTVAPLAPTGPCPAPPVAATAAAMPPSPGFYYTFCFSLYILFIFLHFFFWLSVLPVFFKTFYSHHIFCFSSYILFLGVRGSPRRSDGAAVDTVGVHHSRQKIAKTVCRARARARARTRGPSVAKRIGSPRAPWNEGVRKWRQRWRFATGGRGRWMEWRGWRWRGASGATDTVSVGMLIYLFSFFLFLPSLFFSLCLSLCLSLFVSDRHSLSASVSASVCLSLCVSLVPAFPFFWISTTLIVLLNLAHNRIENLKNNFFFLNWVV